MRVLPRCSSLPKEYGEDNNHHVEFMALLNKGRRSFNAATVIETEAELIENAEMKVILAIA